MTGIERDRGLLEESILSGESENRTDQVRNVGGQKLPVLESAIQQKGQLFGHAPIDAPLELLEGHVGARTHIDVTETDPEGGAEIGPDLVIEPIHGGPLARVV